MYKLSYWVYRDGLWSYKTEIRKDLGDLDPFTNLLKYITLQKETNLDDVTISEMAD